ncbi:histidine kinase/DNA gyrase B/HSP90-like ATPase [Roseimicrobium gellanilyticum]|uniref:histidine kinase n=1 Tax=Roseimicrobium gellanilyticum TaxID=748857 RepID=A0A366HVL8_9BACT|nr:HAMP domain-containing sensor histidine kinase [Roseimicrobium gellanilyticum]RBP47535.1 histidine kinase/DNA gyrase B/HSP90-like ATPase [Roseimicrobium gellanilyticum]
MTAAHTTATSGVVFTHPTLLAASTETGDGYHQELLRGVTHKLNNLLAIIQGFSSLILMNDDLDEGSKENMQHIKEASLAVSGLSERIRVAGGCAKITPQTLNLTDYLSAVEMSLREPFSKAGVPFDIEVSPGLPNVDTDPSKLKDLVLEILRNAASAAQKGGGRALMQISGPGIVTPTQEGSVDILITNTGSTIPADKIQEVFKPFVSSRSSHHLGLGLTVAAMLARQMNVRLGVNSQENMVTFWLSLPMA